MAAKIVLFVCAQVLLMQNISALCRGYNAGLNSQLAAERFAADVYSTERYTADRLGAPFGSSYGSPFSSYSEIPLGYASSASASHGGLLPVASSSPIPASGVSVLSENAIEGPLAVAGQLPFLGTVALEGALPTAGAGAVNFGAGNGNVAMLNEEGAGNGYGPLGYGYDSALGYGSAGYGSAGYGSAGYGFDSALGFGSIGNGFEAGLRRGCGCGARY